MVLNIDHAPTVPGIRRRPIPADMHGKSFRANPEGADAARLAKGDVLPLLDAQLERPQRPRPLRRPHRSLHADLLLRQGAGDEGGENAGHDAGVGAVRPSQRPARNAQSVPRPEIREDGR